MSPMTSQSFVSPCYVGVCRGLEGKTAEPPVAFSHRGVGVARVVGGLRKDGLNEYSVPSPYRGLTGGRRGDQREQAGCRV